MGILFTGIEVEDWSSRFVVGSVDPVSVLIHAVVGRIVMIHRYTYGESWIICCIDRSFMFA